jgi:hypothetical protein
LPCQWRTCATQPNAAFAPPNQGCSAKARILLRPASADSAVIYIDDVAFRPTAPGLAGSADATPSPEDAPPGATAGGQSGVRSAAERAPAEVSGESPADGTLSSTQPSNAPLPTPVLQRRARTPAQNQTAGGDAALVVAGVALVLVAGAVALGGAAWYARRR